MKEIVSLTRSNSLYGGKGIIRMSRSDYLNNAKRLSERGIGDFLPETPDSFARVYIRELSDFKNHHSCARVSVINLLAKMAIG